MKKTIRATDIKDALERIKALGRQRAPPDWTGAEWKGMMERLVSPQAPKRAPAPGLSSGWATLIGSNFTIKPGEKTVVGVSKIDGQGKA